LPVHFQLPVQIANRDFNVQVDQEIARLTRDEFHRKNTGNM